MRQPDQVLFADPPRTLPFLARARRLAAGITWRRVGWVCLIGILYAIERASKGVALNDTRWMEEVLYNVGYLPMYGLPMLGAVMLADHFVPKGGARRIVALAAALVAGSVSGGILFWYSLGGDYWATEWLDHPLLTFRFIVLGGALAAVYFLHARDREAAEALHQAEMDRAGLDKQMLEARLQVMQAQVEPHFLFNTLANVRRLYQTDPAGGRAMLRHLSQYLSAALPMMRAASSTLGQEIELTSAYLNVQQVRMGRRLAFEVAVPEPLAAAAVPPMMLITLVENAIKHGLNPLPEGGFVRISAQAQDGKLRLWVADTGRGFTASSGTGVGLANIRARLAALYGAEAQLRLAENTPRGITAMIELPYRTAAR